MVLAPRYNTHKEQSREHFCQAASYITVLSIIPHRNLTTWLSCDGLSLLVKSCLFGGGTIDKTLIRYHKIAPFCDLSDDLSAIQLIKNIPDLFRVS